MALLKTDEIIWVIRLTNQEVLNYTYELYEATQRNRKRDTMIEHILRHGGMSQCFVDH